MKKSLLLSIFLIGSHAYATKITVQTASAKPICAYINDINELCVTKEKPQSKDIQPRDTQKNTFRVLAVNKRGTVSSPFFTLQVPQNTNAVVLDIQISKKSGIAFTSPTPGVTLSKEQQ